jgi:hypothetical protein
MSSSEKTRDDRYLALSEARRNLVSQQLRTIAHAYGDNTYVNELFPDVPYDADEHDAMNHLARTSLEQKFPGSTEGLGHAVEIFDEYAQQHDIGEAKVRKLFGPTLYALQVPLRTAKKSDSQLS